MIKNSIILLCLMFIVNGCSRDDLCASETATTPLLIIVFNDITNPTEAKAVPGLSVKANYQNDVTVVTTSSVDSIAIPLRTAANDTSFQFIRNTGATNENIDIVTFNYDRQEIYVSRACGFKTQYDNLNATVTSETNSWILNLNIDKETVADEIEAHITILH